MSSTARVKTQSPDETSWRARLDQAIESPQLAAALTVAFVIFAVRGGHTFLPAELNLALACFWGWLFAERLIRVLKAR